jgi:hypothetical protein
VPGALAPDDIRRIALHLGYGNDRDDLAGLIAFARENLQASDGVDVRVSPTTTVRLRTLVPATQANGRCKFLQDGRCMIHSVSPFGCAYIDAHQSDQEFALRADYLYRTLYDDQTHNGIATRIWNELHSAGLDAEPLAARHYRMEKALRREKLI